MSVPQILLISAVSFLALKFIVYHFIEPMTFIEQLGDVPLRWAIYAILVIVSGVSTSICAFILLWGAVS